MEYNKIIAVTGLPGLYELLSSKADGAIVRSLEDKSTRFVSSRIHNFSHLESIEVYTVRDNVNLVDILKAMEATNEKLPDDKDNAALRNYFGKVYPDLDFDRVYSSDLKKMIKWFVVLKANDIEIRLSDPEAGTEEVEEVEEPEIARAPKVKPAPKSKPEPAGKTEAPVKKEKTEKTEKPAAKRTEKAASAEKSTAKKSATPAKKKSTKKKSEK